MSDLIKAAAVAAMFAVSASASAWWGAGPWNSLGDAFDDGWGDGHADFSMNFGSSGSIHSRGFGYPRGHDYDTSYRTGRNAAARGYPPAAKTQPRTVEK